MDRAVNRHPAPTVAEHDAATYIGYTPSALRAWRRDNRGPSFIRNGRSIRYLVADLDAWLSAHRVTTHEKQSAPAHDGQGR